MDIELIVDLREYDIDNLRGINCLEDIVYVIYILGMIGKFKGILVLYRGIDCLVYNLNYVELNENIIVLLLGIVVFDVVIFEIYGLLLNGGWLVIIFKDMLLNF